MNPPSSNNLFKVLKQLTQDPGRILSPIPMKKSSVLITLYPTQGDFPAIPSDSDWDSLGLYLELRADHIPQGGEVCLPGGGLEFGETSEVAALREWVEETGISEEYIQLVGCFGSLVHPTGRIIDVWLAIGPDPRVVPASPNEEVEKLFALSLSTLRNADWKHFSLTQEIRDDISSNPIPYTMYPLREYPRGIWNHNDFYVWFVDGLPHLLWGMTAGILRSFLTVIYKNP